jgi:hypothetical protein
LLDSLLLPWCLPDREFADVYSTGRGCYAVFFADPDGIELEAFHVAG